MLDGESAAPGQRSFVANPLEDHLTRSMGASEATTSLAVGNRTAGF